MENYFQAKAKLFTQDYAEIAVINIDNEYGKRLFSEVKFLQYQFLDMIRLPIGFMRKSIRILMVT